MAIDQKAREQLVHKLEAVLGDDTYTLLEHLPPTGWGDVATVRDLDHTEARMIHRIEQLDSKIDRVAAGLDSKIDRMAAGLDSKIDRVAAGLDSKIDRVAAEIRGEVQTTYAQLVERIADSQRTTLIAFVGALAANSALLFTILEITKR